MTSRKSAPGIHNNRPAFGADKKKHLFLATPKGIQNQVSKVICQIPSNETARLQLKNILAH